MSHLFPAKVAAYAADKPSPVNGDIWYNLGTNKLRKREGGVTTDLDTAGGGVVAIASGGTGQTTAVAAFDALAPTTTAGDAIYHDGTDNVRLPIGTAGQVLMVNAGATAPAWATIPGITDTLVTLGTDRTTTSSSLADVTGLSFAVAANTMYYFKFSLFITANSVNEGNLFSLNMTNAPTFLTAYYTRIVDTPATPSLTAITARDGGTLSAGVTAVNFNLAWLEGCVSVGGSADTLQLRFRTETNTTGSTTCQAGSFCQYRVIT